MEGATWEGGEKMLSGKIYVVGLGPGSIDHLTYAAVRALQKSHVIIGYKVYIKLIEGLIQGKTILSSGMGQELERCEKAIELARQGKRVSLVSSGDPGLYGMAGPLLELNKKGEDPVRVEVVPGVTAASMGAAVLGAPLMHDTAIISLSDLLTPWEVIERRLERAAEADFVTALYNPRSQGRPDYIMKAREIFLRYKVESTPVGIVRMAGRDGQEKIITTLAKMLEFEIDMFSVVIIGNSQTSATGDYIITPRGYSL